MTRPITNLSSILSFMMTRNYRVGRKKNLKISGFRSISSAKKGDMTFCSYSDKKGLDLISSSKASLIICHSGLKNKITKPNSTLIFAENPRLWFIRCMQKFSVMEELIGIHRTAIIESKKIGKNVYVGPYTYVGKNVRIGNDVKIHGHVYIHGNTSIGNNVIIDSSTVIGGDGFGFEKNETNSWEKFPNLGWVEIHDNVDIGANVCIDRGTLENTVIGSGTKIDNLVHIGHNVKIGCNCIIVAQSLLGGSCNLEDNVYVAMCAIIREGIRVGKNALVGMGSVVTKNVPENITVIGVPAHPIKK